MNTPIRQLLEDVKNNKVSIDDALLELKEQPFADIGCAKIDLHRQVRQGAGEVIYAEGKTASQIIEITGAMLASGQKRILITRLDEQKAESLGKKYKITYNANCRIATVGEPFCLKGSIGTIVVATGGTSDIPVAEEAAVTAEFYGNKVTRLYDVGVAGLQRLLSNTKTLMSASVIIVVAGMEGALTSVVGGLADCPVIAVPTSVGYGSAFEGLSALLGMLNSCASGVSVVNIDNGFGAGYLAGMINHMEAKREPALS